MRSDSKANTQQKPTGQSRQGPTGQGVGQYQSGSSSQGRMVQTYGAIGTTSSAFTSSLLRGADIEAEH
jgi:hypothetical protein